ncbi:MAG: hypothetical protein ABH846_00460, partial [Patescibacteria group bacterium]
KKETEEAFRTVVSRIEEKKSAAEANLIYSDNEQARVVLNEAMSLLETLVPDGNNQEGEIQRLKEEINVVLASLQGIQQVAVTSLADLSVIDSSAYFTNSISVGGKIYAVTNGQALYSYNDLEQSWKNENSIAGSIGSVVKVTNHDSGFLFLDNNQRLGRASLTNNTLNPIVSGVESMPSVESIASYNGNVYALSSQAQQIIKMQPQGDGFDAGTNWIKAKDADLSTARSLTIDGDIYVLTNNSVVKFTTGAEQSFTLDTIDPALSNPTQIWTSANDDFLYILDKAEGRIIVFEKNGNFVTQYVSENFKEATSFTVQGDKKTIYVVTATQLFSFTADHLLQ